MAQKKTYLYRMLIGYNDKNEVDIFMYARNKETAINYCKELYRDKKYNHYQAIKVGVSLHLRDTGLVSDYEDNKLRHSVAVQGESYSEREVVLPKYITKEEAGDLKL